MFFLEKELILDCLLRSNFYKIAIEQNNVKEVGNMTSDPKAEFNQIKASKYKRMKKIIFFTTLTTLAILLPIILLDSRGPIQISATTAKKYNKARALLEKGRKLIKNGELDKALQTFEAAIQAYPKLKEAYMDRGKVYQVYKNYQKALAEYDRLLKINNKYAPAYLCKGYVYAELKDWTRAIKQFTKAIKCDPNNIDAYKGRGEAYKNRGYQGKNSADFERSVKDYEKAKQLKKKKKKKKKHQY